MHSKDQHDAANDSTQPDVRQSHGQHAESALINTTVRTSGTTEETSRDANNNHEVDGHMPHERDESPRDTSVDSNPNSDINRDMMRQAHDDVENGLIDTDRRGIPSQVPSSKVNEGKK